MKALSYFYGHILEICTFGLSYVVPRIFNTFEYQAFHKVTLGLSSLVT